MITPTNIFFKDPVKIPNLEAAPNGADKVADFESFKKIEEEEILIDGLGFELYELLETYISSNTTDARFDELLKGKTYTSNGITVRWEGLEGYSFLPYYIRYQWLRDSQSILTTMGMQRPEAVNSSPLSGIREESKMYRKFFKKYQGEDSLPRVVQTRFGSYVDYYGTVNTRRSLCQFLEDNKTDYPEAVFTHKENINVYGV